MADQHTVFALAEQCRRAADKLYGFISRRHLQPDGALLGPAPGTRLNLRIGRFIKSYLPFIPSEHRYYVQAEAYWIASNLHLSRLTGSASFREAALRSAEVVLSRQTPGGHWILDNPEWKDRITTVEACFGGIALLDAYRASGYGRFIDGARKAYSFLVNDCGFLDFDDDSYCIKYFANYPSGLVPNNATLANWFFAELSDVTGDSGYLERCAGQTSFLAKCQLETGELPYVLRLPGDPPRDRPHYLCYQYNSFEFMDLVHYLGLTGDDRIRPVVQRLAGYLSTGFTRLAHARRDCFNAHPAVNYYTAALSAALLTASREGIGDYEELALRGYSSLLAKQKPDGGFGFSEGDYRILSDKRSYPLNQAMILRHLLLAADSSEDAAEVGSAVHG